MEMKERSTRSRRYTHTRHCVRKPSSTDLETPTLLRARHFDELPPDIHVSHGTAIINLAIQETALGLVRYRTGRHVTLRSIAILMGNCVVWTQLEVVLSADRQ
jgi:hypothetical protein